MARTSKALAIFAAPLLVFACMPQAHAQSLWDSIAHKVAHKVADKATQKATDAVLGDDQNNASTDQSDPAHPMLTMNGGYTFAPGNVVLFHGDFSDTSIGSMPQSWKTNGSGEVITLGGVPGRWLKLQDAAVYKLAHAKSLPGHFTVQFDIIPVAGKITDLYGISFGFAHDDSVRSYYDDNSINKVNFGYINGHGIIVSSNATNYDHDYDYDWRGAVNRPVHVAIAVDGDQMRVYLNHTKVADAKLFETRRDRYFFIRSSSSSKHHAALVIGNVRIDGFAPQAAALQHQGSAD